MSSEHDPRTFFASERTLLAWLRTGLAVVGLGFFVARFGLFLRMLALRRADVKPQLAPTVIGVGLVLLGVAAFGVAAWQHHRFVRQLPPADQPENYWKQWCVWFAMALAAIGLMLAGYLLWQVEAA